MGTNNKEDETREQESTGEVRQTEYQQFSDRTSYNIGTDRTGNADLSETVRTNQVEEKSISNTLSNDNEAKQNEIKNHFDGAELKILKKLLLE